MANFVVIGDFMIDRYHIATVERYSPEAPIPVYKIVEEFERPGGAGNLAENVTALADHAYCMARMPYPIKNRILANDTQVVRFDQDDTCFPVDYARLEKFLDNEELNAILVADYAKGSINEQIIDILIDANLPLFVDTKRSPALWANAEDIWFFPNLAEFDQFEGVYRVAPQVILKQSAQGIARMHNNVIEESYPAFTSASEVVSVNGAGDTVLAAFAHALFNATHFSPLLFANAAAAATVRKPFTSTVTPKEIYEIIEKVTN